MKVPGPTDHLVSGGGRGSSGEVTVPRWATEVGEGGLQLAAEDWKAFYDAHFDFVYRTARRLGTPESEAEDVAHDVFVVVHRRLGTFRGGKVTSWLYRITANVSSAAHRRRRVRRAFEQLNVWVGADLPQTPARSAELRSASEQVDQILERMSPKKREVFALFEVAGLAGDEIAARIGCPVNTVWTRLHHSRKEFVRIGRRLGYIEREGAQ